MNKDKRYYTDKAAKKLYEQTPQLHDHDGLLDQFSDTLINITRDYLLQRKTFEALPVNDVERLRNNLIYQIFLAQELLHFTPIFHVCSLCEDPEGSCVDFGRLKDLVEELDLAIQIQGKSLLQHSGIFSGFFKIFLKEKAPTMILGPTFSARYLEGLLR